MAGASRFVWPLAFLAAFPLLLAGCGSNSDPNAATQFRPVDDDEPPAKTEKIAKEKTAKVSPPVEETTPELPGGLAEPTKRPGSTKPPSSSTGKGASERPTTTKGETAESDPALVGATGPKVRRLRSLLGSLRGNLQGETQEEKMQYLMDRLQQVMVTAEEVLAEEKASPEARDEALLARFQVAAMMVQAGLNKEAKDMLSQAAAELAKADNPQYASLGRAQLFELHFEDILKLQPADANEVLTALDTLLEAGADVDIIVNKVMPLVSRLEQFGYPKEGVAAIAKIGDHYASSKEPNEALIGKQLQVSSLVGKLRSGEGDPAELGDQIVAIGKELVELTDANPGAIALLHQLANGQAGDYPEISGKLYDLIEEKYVEHRDQGVADRAKELVDSGRQRLSLVGKPLAITGVLVGGEPFDWSEYQGKVVLVHFWALSSEASLQDLSNKDRLNRKFARRGLSIVGVNLDLNVAKVQELFDEQPLSWPTVTGKNASQRGFKHPAAKECGVIAEALPFSVLVGKDGKIAAAGLQGPVLDEAIVKLLTAEDEEPKEKSEDKTKEGESEAQPEDKQPDESK